VTVSALDLFGSGASFDIDSAIFNFPGSTVNLASIDTAIDAVSTARSTFGAVQNRLQHTLNNLATYEENLSASESQIKDVDMAAEMVTFSKLQVLQQAGTSMLSQANQSQQSVLRLLQ
jgi:flagellin